MRRLPLVLLATAALLSPAAALAGGSTTPAARSFVITGMVLGDQKAEAMGKLSIEGSQLSASVGCNLIGGRVAVDGDTITISEPLAMTEMACPGANGDLEAMLIKVLEHGPFTIADGQWSGNGAALLVEELPAGNPAPNATAPDEPIGSSPGPVVVDPYASCPPLDGTIVPDGGPTSGGGSGSSSGSSSGSGGAPADGSTGVSDGSGSAPSSTAVVEPAPSAIAVPDPGTVTEPGPSVDPDPGFNGKPVSADPCAERMYAVDQGNAGGVGLYPPKADAAEHAASASNPNAPFVALGLVLLTVAAVAVASLRRRQAGVPATDRQPEDAGPTPR